VRLVQRFVPECPTTLVDRGAHYSAGVRADDWSWSVLWHGLGGAQGTVFATVKQRTFEALAGAALPLAVELLASVRPSRIDLAADCLSAGTPGPAALFERRAAAWTRTRREGWELTTRGDGGEKLTIGARASDRYVRVYTGHGGVRHELEAKGAVAIAIGAALRAAVPPMAIWAAEYGRVVRWQ
jgi:hypothetical protein